MECLARTRANPSIQRDSHGEAVYVETDCV